MKLGHDWLIWQLADSAFPTGGFAHSGGLEAAWQHGEIQGRADFMAFVETSLQQLGYASLPFMGAAWEDAGRMAELDERFDVFTVNHVTNRASRLQGRAFWMAAERSFPSVALEELRPQIEAENFCGHLPVMFGGVAAALRLSKPDAIQLFFFCYLRGIVASAVRLGIVGPMEAQGMQFKLSQKAQAVSAECADIAVEDAAQTAPLLDLWQGAQDRLYSRLFQS